jgi:LmbE family N-acetylglucosaminyl deacetylase
VTANPNPIDAPGTSEAAWQAWAGLDRLPAVDPDTWASVVIVAAHPDDEVLGAGGVIAALAAAGTRLRLVAVTDGEASHPGHRDPAALARQRAAERAEALAVLGAGGAEVLRLGLPDTGLADREADLAAALAEVTDGFAVCLAPWERDVHADHEAVGRAARQVAANLLFFPVWTWHWARPGDPRIPWRQAVRVSLSAAAAVRKQAAIACFTSQLEPRPAGGPFLTAEFVTHFTRDCEVLFPVRQP